LAPLLDLLTSFRQQVRSMAMDNAPSTSTSILQLADTLRDDLLPELGVRLEDKGKDQSVWKLDDVNVLRKERELKREAQKLKEAQKAEAG
jgi:cysteinyl-tRNA synthetase